MGLEMALIRDDHGRLTCVRLRQPKYRSHRLLTIRIDHASKVSKSQAALSANCVRALAPARRPKFAVCQFLYEIHAAHRESYQSRRLEPHGCEHRAGVKCMIWPVVASASRITDTVI